MTRRARPRTAVIGAGRLARVLAPALVRARYPVVAVSSRTAGPARALARRIPGARAVLRPESAVSRAELVLLAVPDGEIEGVARHLAGHGEWRERTVLHHAGSLGREALAPLGRRGAGVGVLHPLQCFGLAEIASGLLAGSRARVEGDRRGREAALALARDLGLVPLSLGDDLGRADRVAYHAAASLVSNDLVALLSLAVELLESIGLPEGEARTALAVLSRGTIRQAERGGTGAALTGPVARGDAATLSAQLRRIARQGATGERAHRMLSLRLLELVERRADLPPAEIRELRRLLRSRTAR